MKSLYLCGPDVFLSNAKEVLDQKKALCEKYGFKGLSPMDTEFNNKVKFHTPETAELIYKFDISLMNEADICLANMSPFRGPSMDTGTAFEMGYMTAQGKKVFGYSDDVRPYKEKYKDFLKDPIGDFELTSIYKYSVVEDFGLTDNLIMVCSAKMMFMDFEFALKALKILRDGRQL